jgi:hypothetical protein
MARDASGAKLLRPGCALRGMWYDTNTSSYRLVFHFPLSRFAPIEVGAAMCVRIAELRESLGEYAAGFDADVLSAAQAKEVLEHASRMENIAATLKAVAAARVAETGSWKEDGDRSAAHHLARRTGTTLLNAATAIETVRRLQALPETAAAARRGDLSAEQATAIADAARVDPRCEDDLLEAARRVPLAELRQQCARTKAAGLADPEARRRRIHARRSLRSFTDAEGEWHLHCRNNPEVGARIMAALDPLRESIFREARVEGRHEPPEAYAADALDELARRSIEGGTGLGDAQIDPGDAGHGGNRPADAAERGAGTARPTHDRRPRATPAASGSRPKIIVRVDLGALLRGLC